MRRAHSASILSRERMIGRAACVVAVLALLAAPGRSPAQDAGVSGIPPGPANARGLNGSLNDPSGVGNAARVPALPQRQAARTAETKKPRKKSPEKKQEPNGPTTNRSETG